MRNFSEQELVRREKRDRLVESGLDAFGQRYDREDYANDINNPPEPDTLVYMKLKGKKIKEVQVEMSDREFGESY